MQNVQILQHDISDMNTQYLLNFSIDPDTICYQNDKQCISCLHLPTGKKLILPINLLECKGVACVYPILWKLIFLEQQSKYELQFVHLQSELASKRYPLADKCSCHFVYNNEFYGLHLDTLVKYTMVKNDIVPVTIAQHPSFATITSTRVVRNCQVGHNVFIFHGSYIRRSLCKLDMQTLTPMHMNEKLPYCPGGFLAYGTKLYGMSNMPFAISSYDSVTNETCTILQTTVLPKFRVWNHEPFMVGNTRIEIMQLDTVKNRHLVAIKVAPLLYEKWFQSLLQALNNRNFANVTFK